MKNHSIFEQFDRVQSTGTGNHVFDFLGAATNVSYKKGWEKHAVKKDTKYTPNYPPVNEHYFDWIALLQCVQSATGTFRMAELGAGWAPWLVRGALAAKQNENITNVELVGVEADATHYAWVKEHFLDNKIDPSTYIALHGAVSDTETILKFPKLDNPDEDYGASLRSASTAIMDYVEVKGYTLESILGQFSDVVDFVHVDIQGAEYDVIPSSFDLLNKKVKAMMIGTHISTEKHLALRDLFLSNGWNEGMVYSRNEKVQTEFGEVSFGDGFQFWRNPNF